MKKDVERIIKHHLLLHKQGRERAGSILTKEYWVGRSEELEIFCMDMGKDYIDLFNKEYKQ